MPLFGQATFGQQGGATSSVDNSGLNTDNEISTFTDYAPPLAGRLRTLNCYFAGHGGAVSANLVAWNQAGATVCAESGSFTAANGTGGSGGQTLYTQEVDQSSSFGSSVDPSSNVRFGFFVTPSQAREWGVAAAGNFMHQSTSVVAPLTPLAGCGGPYVCGDIQSYGTMVGVAGHKEYCFDGVAIWKRRRAA